MPTPPSRNTALVGGLVGLAVVLLHTTAVGAWAGSGLDADLWTFATLDLWAGRGAPLAPTWPALVGALSRYTGLLPGALGLPVGLASAFLTSAGTTALALRLGARPAAAVAAGALVVGLPHSGVLFTWVGPDALFMALIVGSTLAVEAAARRPGPLPTLALLLLLPALCLVRELGPAVAFALGLGLLASRTGARSRLRALAVLSAAAGLTLLAPAALPGSGALPWDWEWLARVGQATGASTAPPEAPAWATEAGRAMPLARTAWVLGRAPEQWVLLALGTLAAVRSRRAWLVAPLATSLLALGIWSQPRHVAVLLPLAAVALAAAATGTVGALRVPPLGRPGRLLLLLATLLALGRWVEVGPHARHMAREFSLLRSFGHSLCATAGPGDLASGALRPFTFCPLPRTAMDRHDPAVRWLTWFAGEQAPGPGWSTEGLRNTEFAIWRFAPELTAPARPCSDSRPSPETRTFPTSGLHARVEPPCLPAPAQYAEAISRALPGTTGKKPPPPASDTEKKPHPSTISPTGPTRPDPATLPPHPQPQPQPRHSTARPPDDSR